VTSTCAWSGARESFDFAVPVAPSPVNIDGRDWLIYELHLTNFSREPLRLTHLDVLTDGADVLQSFAGDELALRTSNVGASRIVYLEVSVNARHPPLLLRHRLRYATDDGREVDEVVGGEVRLSTRTRLTLGAPLRGGPWAAVYAWQWPRGHRRVFYTLDGRARLPGRFAIDWVRQDEQGLTASGDADIVKNALGYGADVLAVANARVADARDGITESTRVSANPKHPPDEAAGNFIALDLGDGRFAIYEHLAPGSIRVARGERVRRGQVLASLGFTGDSTGPHLHFHVADNPLPLLGEGLPFELDRFRVHGAGVPQMRKRERPAPNAVVSFD
jgi:murein DD-endopeptidase